MVAAAGRPTDGSSYLGGEFTDMEEFVVEDGPLAGVGGRRQ